MPIQRRGEGGGGGPVRQSQYAQPVRGLLRLPGRDHTQYGTKALGTGPRSVNRKIHYRHEQHLQLLNID